MPYIIARVNDSVLILSDSVSTRASRAERQRKQFEMEYPGATVEIVERKPSGWIVAVAVSETPKIDIDSLPHKARVVGLLGMKFKARCSCGWEDWRIRHDPMTADIDAKVHERNCA